MVWIREHNFEVLGKILLDFCFFIVVQFFIFFILDIQENWRGWAKICLLLVILIIGYIVAKLMPADLFGAAVVLDKYEPSRFILLLKKSPPFQP
jgi:hypothetical protein